MEPVLRVSDLRVSFFTHFGQVQAVRGVSFALTAGETLAIVGESGCGKTVTAQSLLRLVPSPGRITGGQILFAGRDLVTASEKALRQVRGGELAMIFQDPMTALNPTLTIGRQLTEGMRHHLGLDKAQAMERAAEALARVGLADPEKRLAQYPHAFSGGMRQRVMIAMAMACRPKVLVADEPTTALDVTIQAQILELMRQVQRETGTAIILISHDLGVVAGLARQVLVMYAGQIVESGLAEQIFYQAAHPYTLGLLKSVPRLNRMRGECLTAIPGQPPDLLRPPAGCPFAARCSRAMVICHQLEPPCLEVDRGHHVSCWLQHRQASEGRGV